MRTRGGVAVSGLCGADVVGHLLRSLRCCGATQSRASTSEPSLQETAAFLEGLFAASYAAQPLVDVEGCYEVRAGVLLQPWLTSELANSPDKPCCTRLGLRGVR
jgi:hypothetical protein